MEQQRIRTTLSNMGLRAETSLTKHILQENWWESNFVADISNVNYLEGNEGRTNLQPLDGLPLFVDDFYVFGFLDQTEIVHVRGRKVSCEPVAKQSVQDFDGRAGSSWGAENKHNGACKRKRL